MTATATISLPALSTSDISRLMFDEQNRLKGDAKILFKRWIERLEFARLHDRYGDIWSGYCYSLEQVGQGQALRHFMRQDGGQNCGLKRELISFIKRSLQAPAAVAKVA